MEHTNVTTEEMMDSLLTLAEAAKLLRISRRKMYAIVREKRVPVHQVGGRGRFVFKPEELMRAVTTPAAEGHRDNQN